MMWRSITTNAKWSAQIEKIILAYSDRFRRYPTYSATMLIALDAYTDKYKEVFIVGPNPESFNKKLQEFHPNLVFFSAESEASPELLKRVPWLEKKTAKNNIATAYVCHAFICKLPTTDMEIFGKLLQDTNTF